MMKINLVQDSTQGLGYWKFSNFLVEDKYFANLLTDEISLLARDKQDPSDPIVKWEYIKYKCGESSRQYLLETSKERKSVINANPSSMPYMIMSPKE